MKWHAWLSVILLLVLQLCHCIPSGAILVGKGNTSPSALRILKGRTTPAQSLPSSVDDPDGNIPMTRSHRIRCIGRLPRHLRERRWIHSDGQILSESFNSSQSFCAFRRYGGALGNMGMYCLSDTPRAQVARGTRVPSEDEITEQARISFKEAFTFCMLRCRCLLHEPAQNSYDKNPESLQLFPPGNPFYRAELEGVLLGNFAVEYSALTESIRLTPRPREHVPFCADYMYLPGRPPGAAVRVPNRLPAPFQSSDFNGVINLCAAEFFGGKRIGNAGGVCKRRSNAKGSDFRLREVYAHPSLMASNGEAGLRVARFCEAICFCMIEDMPEDKELLIDVKGGNDAYIQYKDGALHARVKEGGPIQGLEVHIQKTGIWAERKFSTGSSAEEGLVCLAGDRNNCYRNLDDKVDADGEDNEDDISLAVNGNTCRGSCHGQADCGEVGCSCVLRPSESALRWSGYQPFLPPPFSACISMWALHKASAATGKPSGDLGGRSTDTVSLSVSCLCNHTFASPGCCFAGSDGLVWEDPTLKMGVLDEEP